MQTWLIVVLVAVAAILGLIWSMRESGSSKGAGASGLKDDGGGAVAATVASTAASASCSVDAGSSSSSC